MTRSGERFALGLLLLCWGACTGPARAQAFDPVKTRITFQLHTRWGQQLDGQFPEYRGEIRHLSQDRQQVTMSLATGAVEIIGYPRYTAFSRGPRFFDAGNNPSVTFTSDPYPPDLLRTGGKLTGTLRMHGVSQQETFTVAPSTCAQPAIRCDLVAQGSVRREDYRMEDWQFAVRGRVRFELRLRLAGNPTP